MPGNPPSYSTMRRKVLVNFGLFFIFFIFYLLAAIIQTPTLKDLATLPVLGLPQGLLLSLLVFPVSWIIMAIWFWRAR